MVIALPFFNKMKYILIFILFVFYVMSFLSSEHYFPWPTYESEKFTFYAYIVFTLFFLKKKKKNIKFYLINFLILLLLISSIFIFFIYDFKQYYYIFNLYLLNIFIFSIIISNYGFEKEYSIKFIVFALLFSGIVSAIFSIYQWLGLFKDSFWIGVSPSIRPFANLAQPNHLATLLLLSLGSCLYFINRYKLYLFVFFIPLLIFSMILTQSRTVWLALLCMLIMVFIKWKVVNNKIKYIILSLIPMYVLFGCFISQSDAVNVADRATSGFLRLLMWEDFFQVLPHLSFLGVGWRNIEYYQFFYGDKSPEYLMSYHNILLDLIVLFGLPGFLLFFYIFFKLIYVFKEIKSTNDFLIFVMLFVLINHSLLEFPLFYNYFLMVFLVFLTFLFKSYNLNQNIFFINKNIFSCFVFFVLILTFTYTQIFEKNRNYYRSVFLGKCVDNFENSIFFDEFDNLSLINCEKNILIENLPKFEAALLERPAPRNILKLVYVYHRLGEYHKRDDLLARYNVKYFPKYALSEVLEIQFFKY